MPLIHRKSRLKHVPRAFLMLSSIDPVDNINWTQERALNWGGTGPVRVCVETRSITYPPNLTPLQPDTCRPGSPFQL
jgi:hypothetical protein